jgi:hypothetical protein
MPLPETPASMTTLPEGPAVDAPADMVTEPAFPEFALPVLICTLPLLDPEPVEIRMLPLAARSLWPVVTVKFPPASLPAPDCTTTLPPWLALEPAVSETEPPELEELDDEPAATRTSPASPATLAPVARSMLPDDSEALPVESSIPPEYTAGDSPVRMDTLPEGPIPEDEDINT